MPASVQALLFADDVALWAEDENLNTAIAKLQDAKYVIGAWS